MSQEDYSEDYRALDRAACLLGVTLSQLCVMTGALARNRGGFANKEPRPLVWGLSAAAHQLSMSLRGLCELVKAGQIAFVKIPGQPGDYILETELQRYASTLRGSPRA